MPLNYTISSNSQQQHLWLTFFGLMPCLRTCSRTMKKCWRGMWSESSCRPNLILLSMTWWIYIIHTLSLIYIIRSEASLWTLMSVCFAAIHVSVSYEERVFNKKCVRFFAPQTGNIMPLFFPGKQRAGRGAAVDFGKRILSGTPCMSYLFNDKFTYVDQVASLDQDWIAF